MKQALGGRARGPLHPAAVVTKGCPQTTTQPASPAAGSSGPKAAPPSYRGRLQGGEGCTPHAVVRWSPSKGHRGSLTGQIWGPHGDFASGKQGCRRPQAGHGSQRWGKGQSWTWGIQQGLQGVTREGPGTRTGVRASWAQESGPAGHRGQGQPGHGGQGRPGHGAQGQLGTGVRVGLGTRIREKAPNSSCAPTDNAFPCVYWGRETAPLPTPPTVSERNPVAWLKAVATARRGRWHRTVS